MINIKNIALVPKTSFSLVVSNVNNNDRRLQACSEMTFKLAMYSKVKLLVEAKTMYTRIKERHDQAVLTCCAYLDKATFDARGFVSISNIRNELVDDLSKSREHLIKVQQDVDFYISQINESAGEYLTMAMFDMSEWSLRD